MEYKIKEAEISKVNDGNALFNLNVNLDYIKNQYEIIDKENSYLKQRMNILIKKEEDLNKEKEEYKYEIEKLKGDNDDLKNVNQNWLKALFKAKDEYNKKNKELLESKNLINRLKLKNGNSEYINNNLKEEIDA